MYSIDVFSVVVFSGIFQSSTFGFAGILPQKYTAAVMSGQVMDQYSSVCTCTEYGYSLFVCAHVSTYMYML